MKITFLGTRGYIEPKSRLHRRHTVTRFTYKGRGATVDCGENWAGHLDELDAKAFVITHAHPDHVDGLRDGTDRPVYATEEAWDRMEPWPIEDRHVVRPREPFTVRGVTFEAFPVVHSTRCPAVGYRISAGVVTVFYVPDLVYIEDRQAALHGCKLYIGDGATVERSMVRKPEDTLIGHTPVRTQLTWCRKLGVPKMFVTHCGSDIVGGDERKVGPKISRMAAERGVEAEIAHDGQETVVR